MADAGGLRTRASDAYARIRRAILEVEYPPSTALSESQLAETLGLSRTPVREALKILEREGLVRSFPGRGTFVAEMSVEDVVEIYEVRLLLEPHAARVAATALQDVDVETLGYQLELARDAVEQRRLDDAFNLDIDLHARIVTSTRNSRIVRIVAQMGDQVHRLRVITSHNPERVVQTLAEHKRIVDALIRRDGDAAEEAMREHLVAARSNAIASIVGWQPILTR